MLVIDQYSSKIWEIQDLISNQKVPSWSKKDIDLAPKFLFNKRSGIPDLFFEFGKELSEKGLLRLPFEKVAFEYESEEKDKVKFNQHVFLCSHLSLDEINFNLNHEDMNIQIFISVIGLHRNIDSDWELVSKKPIVISPTTIYWEAIDTEHRNSQYIQGMIGSDAGTCMRSIAALSSSCFTQKEIIVPTQLQKARSKSGKLPLYEFKVVELSVADSARHPPIGTHSSPALHWRRGHYRRLSLTKIVPVSPCLVGNINNGIIHKDYDARNIV